MEIFNKILKYLIIIGITLTLAFIISSYLGILESIFIFIITLFLAFILKKKLNIEQTEITVSKKVNVIIVILLFSIAFIIRMILLKILQIAPVSDFAVLLNASKQLSIRC